MHLSINAAEGKYHVWSDVNESVYMLIASFEYEQDAQVFVTARMAPMDLGEADLVTDDSN